MYRPSLNVDWNDPTQKELEFIRVELVRNALRQVTYFWPPRTKAIKKATTKRGFRKCARCKDEFNHKECQVDHKQPVVPIDASLDMSDPDWNVFVQRLLPVKGWQVLCKTCHEKKSALENKIRDKNKERNNA